MHVGIDQARHNGELRAVDNLGSALNTGIELQVFANGSYLFIDEQNIGIRLGCRTRAVNDEPAFQQSY